MVRSVLLYVNPSGGDEIRRVTVAADLVEALTFASDDAVLSETPRIGVVAETTHCHEIGLSLLGRELVPLARPNGLVSPVTLFPFTEVTLFSFGDPNLSPSRERERAAAARLRQLSTSIPVNPLPEQFGRDEPADAISAFRMALAAESWELVVRLEGDLSRGELGSFMHDRRTEDIPRDDARRDVQRLLGLLEPAGQDDQSPIRRRAVEDAVLFASIMERIDGDGDERTRGAFSVSVS
jgi:hypothetical protein